MSIFCEFKDKYLNTQSFNYFFAATTIGSSVTGITSVAVLAISGDLDQFKRNRVKKIILYSRAPSLLALGALPFITVHFSKQVVGMEDRHSAYCPILAALSGWMGSSISLGSLALMSQSNFFKNTSLIGRYGLANRVGSVASMGVAFVIAETVKIVKLNRH